MNISLAHLYLLASTYGSGAYGGNVYGAATSPSPLVQIGPLSLPATGAGWLVLSGAAMLAGAGGVWVWLWQKRRAQ